MQKKLIEEDGLLALTNEKEYKAKNIQGKLTKEKFGEILFLISAIMSIFLIILITFFIFRSGIDFVRQYGLIKFISGK